MIFLVENELNSGCFFFEIFSLPKFTPQSEFCGWEKEKKKYTLPHFPRLSVENQEMQSREAKPFQSTSE
jgi:hypothetical protein